MRDFELLFGIAKSNARGELESDAMGAMLEALATGSVLRPVEKNALNSREISMTQDSKGHLLVAGQNYMLRGKKVKVLREEFGSGNMLDTYYRIFYLNEALEETWVVVDARYPKGIESGAVYRSHFEPIMDK